MSRDGRQLDQTLLLLAQATFEHRPEVWTACGQDDPMGLQSKENVNIFQPIFFFLRILDEEL